MGTNDFTYQVGLKLDNKGYIVAVNQATGETVQFDRALDGAGETSKRFSAAGVGSMVAVAAAAGAAYVAISTLKNLTVELTNATIDQAAEQETLRTRLETFTGSAESAEKRLKELLTLAANTPLRLNNLIEAEIQLRNYGGALLATNDYMVLVGDAATAVDRPINDVAKWFGRAYQAIQNGDPLGQVYEGLRDLGIAAPEVAKEVDRLRASGEDVNQVWSVFASGFKRYAGAMEKGSKTFNGLVSTMDENWGQLLTTIGEHGPLDVAKKTIKEISDNLLELNENGELGQNIGLAIAEGLQLATQASVAFFESLGTISNIVLFTKSSFGDMVLFGQKALAEFHKATYTMMKPLFLLLDQIDNVVGDGTLWDKSLKNIDQIKESFDGAIENLEEERRAEEEAQLRMVNQISRLKSTIKEIGDEIDKAQEASIAKIKEQLKQAKQVNEELEESGKSVSESVYGFEQALKQLQDGSTIDTTGQLAMISAQMEWNHVLEESIELADRYKSSEEKRQEEIERITDQIELLKGAGEEAAPIIERLEVALDRLLNPESKKKKKGQSMADQLMTLQDVAADMRYSFEDMVASMLVGASSISDAFQGMIDNVIASLAQYAAEWITHQLIILATQKTATATDIAVDKASIASDFVRGVAGINAWAYSIPFAGPAIAAAYTAQMLAGLAAAQAIAPTITGFAEGGVIEPVYGGQVILAGEAGKREVIAPEDNFIEWADQVASGSVGPGRGGLTINVHGSINGKKEFDEMIYGAEKRLARRFAR